MATQVYLAGGLAHAVIPITAPSGFSITAAIALTTDAAGQAVVPGFPTPQTPAQTSNGTAQNFIRDVPIPAAGGTWYVAVDVFVNGILYAIYMQVDRVSGQFITVGPIVWT